MDRRSFIGSILALAAAPAIVRADSLMRIVPRGTTVLAGMNPIFSGGPIVIDGLGFSYLNRDAVRLWAARVWAEAIDETFVRRFLRAA